MSQEVQCTSSFGFADMETVNATIETSIPEKSRKLYELAYQKFMSWAETQNIQTYSENVLLAYFTNLAEKLQSSSLYAQYSMIKAELNIKHNINIATYTKLIAFLKQRGIGYEPKKSKAFTREQLLDFLHHAPNNKYLAIKVMLLFGIRGSCRCGELLQMAVDDIQDLGKVLLIKIPSRTTKSRTFTIKGDFYINLYREYAALRPAVLNISRFFIKYQNGRCHRVVIGIHKISNVPKEVATFLKLPNQAEYTGHSLRRTPSEYLADDYGNYFLQRRGDWKATTAAEEFLDESLTDNELSSTSDTFSNFETTNLNHESSTGKSVPVEKDNATVMNQELKILQKKLSPENVSFGQLCRLCASNRDVSTNLTDFKSDNLTILDKLNTIAPNILESNIHLPNGICATCIINVNHAYTFISNCVQTQKVYKQYLKQTQNELPTNIPNSVKYQPFEAMDVTEAQKDEKLETNSDNKQTTNSETNFESIFVKCEAESDYEDEDNMLEYEPEFNKNVTAELGEEYVNVKTEIIEENTVNKTADAVFPSSSKTDTRMTSGHFLDPEYNRSSDSSGRTFSSATTSNVLSKNRSSIYNHQCIMCDSAYLIESDLIKHMITHGKI